MKEIPQVDIIPLTDEEKCEIHRTAYICENCNEQYPDAYFIKKCAICGGDVCPVCECEIAPLDNNIVVTDEYCTTLALRFVNKHPSFGICKKCAKEVTGIYLQYLSKVQDVMVKFNKDMTAVTEDFIERCTKLKGE